MIRPAFLAICATAAIFAASAAHAQDAKTWIYKNDGTIKGWIVTPQGSQKSFIYNRDGQRIGTVEPSLTGSGQRLVGPTGAPRLQTAPSGASSSDAFPGDGADPFADDGNE